MIQKNTTWYEKKIQHYMDTWIVTINVFLGEKHIKRIYKMNKAIEEKIRILAWASLVQLDAPGPDPSLSGQTGIGLGSKWKTLKPHTFSWFSSVFSTSSWFFLLLWIIYFPLIICYYFLNFVFLHLQPRKFYVETGQYQCAVHQRMLTNKIQPKFGIKSLGLDW